MYVQENINQVICVNLAIVLGPDIVYIYMFCFVFCFFTPSIFINTCMCIYIYICIHIHDPNILHECSYSYYCFITTIRLISMIFVCSCYRTYMYMEMNIYIYIYISLLLYLSQLMKNDQRPITSGDPRPVLSHNHLQRHRLEGLWDAFHRWGSDVYPKW